jgi:hypothetical protein
MDQVNYTYFLDSINMQVNGQHVEHGASWAKSTAAEKRGQQISINSSLQAVSIALRITLDGH